eukprot:1196271-Prorocentrum_minimum.AAC.7
MCPHLTGWSTGHEAPRWAAGKTGLPRPALNYITHHVNYITHHVNYITHHVNYLTHHVNYITHHVHYSAGPRAL